MLDAVFYRTGKYKGNKMNTDATRLSYLEMVGGCERIGNVSNWEISDGDSLIIYNGNLRECIDEAMEDNHWPAKEAKDKSNDT